MKQRIKVAARQSTPKNLSRNHYTTLGFGRVFPVYCEEVPNDTKLTFKASNFSRVAPQFLPNLGTIKMKMHAFYVPFSLVWNHFNNFQVGLPSWNNSGSQIYKYAPTLCDCDFTSMFITSDNELATVRPSGGSGEESFDFVVYNDATSSVTKYLFTSKGKYFYQILCSLGINFNFISWSTYRNNGDFVAFNKPYSILPLLCFFKAYLDYFIPSQLQPSSHLNHLFQKLHEVTASDLVNIYFMQQAADNLRQDLCVDIMEFVNELYYYYQNNYFTSAWMSPNAVVPGLNNIGNTNDFPVINSLSQQYHAVNTSSRPNWSEQAMQQTDFGVTKASEMGSPSIVSINNSRLTADGLTVLQKFARFIRRSNFVGSRSVERILGMFGIRVTDYEAGMSTYLGSDTIVLQQTDVTVTGNNEQAGDMAGKGWFSSGNNPRTFKCNADLYGYVFVTACLETPSMLVDGVRRRTRHIQPLDFYNPDFDGTVMQAIAGDEVMARNLYLTQRNAGELNDRNLTSQDSFGYQLRYSEFKNSIDDLSGDFAVPSLRGNIDNFILPRRLYDYIGYDTIVHGTNIMDEGMFEDAAYSPDLEAGQTVSPIVLLKADDSQQFNRIFKDTEGRADPVFSVFRFDVVVNNAVIPLDTSAELDGRGKELEFESNGVHV